MVSLYAHNLTSSSFNFVTSYRAPNNHYIVPVKQNKKKKEILSTLANIFRETKLII